MPGLFQALIDGVTRWNLNRKVENKVVVELPKSRYEAAYPLWKKRSYIPGSIQDARLDASPGVRRELLKNSRYWEQNNAYMNRMLDLFEAFTVGANGLHVVPNSADDDYNNVASPWWRKWSQGPARDNLKPLGELQGLMARSWFVDGEIFINLTSYLGRPAIQLIESHRVETPGDKDLVEGANIQDGVEIDSAGRPIAYWVRQRDTSSFYGVNSLMGAMQVNYTPPGTYMRITVANMIHIFEPSRPGMTRGLPMCTAIERDLHDLDDLQDLEMQKAKENATTAKVVKTKTGEAPSSAAMYRQKYQTQSQDANGNAVTKAVPQFYELTQGGDVIYMQPNEDMQEFRSETPSAATQAHWEQIIGKACIGIGIPRVLVVPYTIQGTVLRADIETAAAYFAARSAIVAFAMSRLYQWSVGWAVDYDPAFKGVSKPADWDAVIVRPPRSINVDVSRQSTALINEMNAGIRTLADVCNPLGLDWREVLKQRAKEAKFINDLAEKDGIPREQIALPPKPAIPAVIPGDDGSPPPTNGNGSAHFKLNGHAKRLELV